MNYTAILLGATGLVGGHLLTQLLADERFVKVVALTRKPLAIVHGKLENIVTDFSSAGELLKDIKADILFSCLGTTRRKTPDLQQYRNIEIEIPRSAAQALKVNGLSQLHFVSAIGTNSKSSNFYIQIKYEAEQALQGIGVQSTYLYRPSLIVGARKEVRFMEKLAETIFSVVNLLLQGSLKKYRSIKAEAIAAKMLQMATKAKPGVHTVYFP